MISLNELIAAFNNDLYFAWKLLHAEIFQDSAPVNTPHLKDLLFLYSHALQTFNSNNIPHQAYFKHKINSLMASPKVITCLHSQPQTESENKDDTQTLPSFQTPVLLERKNELELRIAYDIEQTKNVKLKKFIKQQTEKSKKMQGLVQNCIKQNEQRLSFKIKRRQSRISETRKLRNSFEWSSQSTVVGDNQFGYLNINDISFSNDRES